MNLAQFRQDSAPAGQHLRRVLIEGCSQKNGFTLALVHALSEKLDNRSTCTDGVWRVMTPGVPDRLVRLFNGSESILEFLTKYSFIGRDGCSFGIDTRANALANLKANATATGTSVDMRKLEGLKTRTPRFQYEPGPLPISTGALCEAGIVNVGMPQPSRNSGLCWYGSLWFSTIAPERTRSILLAHFASCRDATSRLLTEHVPHILSSPERAETVRRHLFDVHNIGDNWSQNPEKDGQNGYSQFSMLCSALKFPLVTVIAPWLREARMDLTNSAGQRISPPPIPRGGQPCLLGVRNYRTTWQPPEHLTILGRRWTLQSAFIGSEWCGHQVALARSCGDRWALYDSDGVRLSIGPISWKVGFEHFWDVLKYVIPFSNRSHQSKFCDMSPENKHPLKLVHALFEAEGIHNFMDKNSMYDKTHQQVNVDWIYSSN